ncbi:hypothetical protein Plim_3721 [Planctopirus limnophila DSM 3776]|uniref:Uncharacterized protein n=1 Tax=Planctopirus limnophila (strain ATCC 43296 / DSM 3776 / IFAM 1008 / Mu 290) TaxID=521674 RepID=D5SWE0_PLAL2|nr:hypothetical protein Plim_3721 [Planctopirus limnophila DSM 3776]
MPVLHLSFGPTNQRSMLAQSCKHGTILETMHVSARKSETMPLRRALIGWRAAPASQTFQGHIFRNSNRRTAIRRRVLESLRPIQ